MAKQNKLIITVVTIIILLLAVYVVWGLILRYKATQMCKEICDEVDAVTYHVKRSGNYKLDDICICFKVNSILTIRIDEWHGAKSLFENYCKLTDEPDPDFNCDSGGAYYKIPVPEAVT